MSQQIVSPALKAVKDKVQEYFSTKNHTKNQWDEYEKACLIEKVIELEKSLQNQVK